MKDILNVLVVGFGVMGCRHVQSLIGNTRFRIFVIENNKSIIYENLVKIGANESDIEWIASIKEINFRIDLAIVATASAPRYEIVKQLLERGVTRFLLEKIVFQSDDQFSDIITLADQKGAKLYCNFVNRYFEPYKEIRVTLAERNKLSPILINVYGGLFGLGCNAIHYLDIFQYITGSDEPIFEDFNIEKLDAPNRRGSQYVEFSGFFNASNGLDRLIMISDKNMEAGVTITITCGETSFILSEQSGKFFISDYSKLSVKDFVIIPTSRLTSIIVEDIMADNCRLTLLEDTRHAHYELFRLFNETLTGNHSRSLLCPIT